MTDQPGFYEGVATGLRLSQNVTDVIATGHQVVDTVLRPCGHDVPRAAIRMRQVGWLDQRGRVWVKCPPMGTFDGGSLTPLLIQIEDG